jgi:LCP family protein required for cell wall assembly
MMEDHQIPQSEGKTPAKRGRGLKIGLGVALAVILAVASYTAFAFTRNFVSSWEITSLPGLSIQRNPTSTPGGDEPTQPAPSIGPTPQVWDGASRVTVLVMGLDYRDWEADQGAPRTDTMMLLTVDPLAKTAGMLSIPRDLWVNIPGFQPNKINTAHRFGEVYKLPGGGPGLAIKTVEQLLGVPINYYAIVDFYAFERMIDEIGGIEVDVPEEIKVDPLGKGNTVVLEPGLNLLDGPVALAYARARNTEGGDFDRAQRQQQVVLAIRDKVLNLNMLPTLAGKSQVLYNEIASGVKTNMTLEEAIKLAWLAQGIAKEDIKRGVIGTEHVAFGKSPDGLDISKPLPEKIRLLRDEIFTSDVSSPAARDRDPLALAKAEAARVLLLNGATVFPQNDGLASRTETYLQSLGLSVAEIGNAQETIYTSIVDYTGNPYTVGYLVDLMGIPSNRIYSQFDPNSQVDVEVSLGNDWAVNNNMP